MPESKAEYYLHFVWTTQQRTPLLTPDVEASLHRCIQAEARRLRCVVLALDGTAHHVHLVLQANPAYSPSQIMQGIKGVSSKFIADEFVRRADHPLDWFHWQEGYGVFSFSSSQKPRVVGYVQNQKRCHAGRDELWPSCEPAEALSLPSPGRSARSASQTGTSVPGSNEGSSHASGPEVSGPARLSR